MHILKQLRNRILAVITAWLAFTAAAQTDKALLWKVTGPDLKEPSYLFGTYHLLTDKYVETLPEITAPFQAAKGVVVEMVLDSAKLAAMGMMAIMPNNKVSSLIKPEEAALVSKELEKLIGVKLEAVDQLKPMTIMVMMTMIYAQKQNAALLEKYKGLPMDYQFAATGKKQGKIVSPLETQEEQAKLLYDAFPLEEQARQLVTYVNQKELAAQSQVDLANLYLAKDLSGMFNLADSMPDEFGSADYLLKDRNIKWMNVLPGLMKTGSQFIALGALHLPGPNGLITLLRQKGYAVTPMP